MMFQDELADHYFLYKASLRKQAAEKQKEDAEHLVGPEDSILSVLCQSGLSDPLLLNPTKAKHDIETIDETDRASLISLLCQCSTEEPKQQKRHRLVHHHGPIDAKDSAQNQSFDEGLKVRFFRRMARSRRFKAAARP